MIGTKLNNEGHFNIWLLSHKDVMRLPTLAPPESYPVWLIPSFAEFKDGRWVVGVLYLYPKDLREMLASFEPEPTKRKASERCLLCNAFGGHTVGCRLFGMATE